MWWSWVIALFVPCFTPVPVSRALTSRKRRIHAGVLRSMKAYFACHPLRSALLSLGINSMEGGEPRRLDKGRLAYHWGTFIPI